MMSGYRSPNLPHCSATVISWLTQPRPDAVASTTASWSTDDWEAARWAIQVHGIAPLLDRAFESSPNRAALPERLHTYLGQQRRLSGQRVARLLDDLVAILQTAVRQG